MGCKAEGAAQGYTILGGIVLILSALQRIINNMNSPGPGTVEGIMQIVLGIVLLVVVLLAFDACGFVYWKLRRSGALLALFGFIAILIVSWPGITLDILGWLQSLDTLAGFMILIAGLLLLVSK
ncbi:MAG: hypothetical protein JW779_12690 [Candidatus Thorarchaeota archaeon]|nr:hypothetical protein [Candidatus Thorarchaeota archaeon]